MVASQILGISSIGAAQCSPKQHPVNFLSFSSENSLKFRVTDLLLLCQATLRICAILHCTARQHLLQIQASSILSDWFATYITIIKKTPVNYIKVLSHHCLWNMRGIYSLSYTNNCLTHLLTCSMSLFLVSESELKSLL